MSKSKKKPYGDGNYLDVVSGDKSKLGALINKAYLAWGGDATVLDKEKLGPKLELPARTFLKGLHQAITDVFGMNDGTGNTTREAFNRGIARIAKMDIPGGENPLKIAGTAGYVATIAWQGTIDSSKIDDVEYEAGLKALSDVANFVLNVNGKNADQVLNETRGSR